MKVLETRNVHSVFPNAISLLFSEGVERDSRNGKVLQYPTPVTTVYSHPLERVIFWPERDANPFFHLYEALWMLAGRKDVAGVSRYAANMVNFSDTGVDYHGAYGYRWRRAFPMRFEDGFQTCDQLYVIANALKSNRDDRRCVLQMWNSSTDLGQSGKDFPCNTIATFQINTDGALDLSLFCRSNDIVWGAYGANAVQFAFLLEYMALWIGVPVGKFYQTSVNWHGYLTTLEKVKDIHVEEEFTVSRVRTNPYEPHEINREHWPLVKTLPLASPGLSIDEIDVLIHGTLRNADNGFKGDVLGDVDQPFFIIANHVLKAHMFFKANASLPKNLACEIALEELSMADQKVDWVVAATQWIQRRMK